MRLLDLDEHRRDGCHVLEATVRWEDSERADLRLHVRTSTEAPSAMNLAPEVFLPLVATAAHVQGETRLSVEGTTDPALLAGIEDALTWFSAGDLSHRSPLILEAEAKEDPGPAGSKTMALVTGGVDSTASLLDNHRRYGPRHPRRVRLGMVVYGLDESTDGDARHPDGFLLEICEAFGIDLIAVETNLRELDPSVLFWWDRAQTPLWSGTAHAFAADVRELVIGSDEPLGEQSGRPFRGSDPILDNCFVSTHLRINRGVNGLTRSERVQLVASSDTALERLQVCNEPRATWRPLNCGRCEKCIRTMLQLTVVDALERATSFPGAELTPDAVAGLRFRDWEFRIYYEALAPMLETHGLDDLADATRLLLRRNRQLRLRRAGRDVVRGAAAASGSIRRRQ